MTFQLPNLPFEPTALAPHISRETIELHYGRHHRAYVNKTNELSKGHESSLEELVLTTGEGPLFNNAAQAWNHTFYWHCLCPDRTQPSGALASALRDAFGDLDGFHEEFAKHAIANFGSGWTWLVRDPAGGLGILNTANAGTPLTSDRVPLLVADVWEHAYYLDYRNERPKHVEALRHVLDWRFASARFDAPGAFEATPEMRGRAVA